MKKILSFLLIITLFGCNHSRIDGGGLSDATSRDWKLAEKVNNDIDDWRNNITPIEDTKAALAQEKANYNKANIANSMMMPETNLKKHNQLVTIAATSDVPVKDILLELSRRANVDVEIDPNIEGSVILTANNKPFSSVIKRITRQANLVHEYDGDVLRIMQDTSRIKSYQFNILNMIRTSQGNVNLNTDLGGDAEGIGTGSSSSLTSASEDADIWAMVEMGIKNILGNCDTNESCSNYTINKVAGVITIEGNNKEHNKIKNYLDKIHQSLSSQVLIEAKVVEVSLKDQYRSGIDWSSLAGNAVNGTVGFGNINATSLGSLNANLNRLFNITNEGNEDINTTVNFLENFGVTRTLSSPRLMAMNNQHAVLTFAENFVYFELEYESTETDTTSGVRDNTSVDSEIKTVPVGITLTMLPSIDLARDEVMMNVRPTLSRINETRSDPAVDIISSLEGVDNDIKSEIPVVEVRELDSVFRVKNGEVMVIGGLMEERTDNQVSGVPGASRIPFFGNAFRNVADTNEVVETVIFLKATIVPGYGVTVEDANFYNTYIDNRRTYH